MDKVNFPRQLVGEDTDGKVEEMEDMRKKNKEEVVNRGKESLGDEEKGSR